MAVLSDDRYLEALTSQSARFAEALCRADLQQRVPTCPDWTMYQLAEHLGHAHRWVTAIVTRRVTTPIASHELSIAPAPDDPDALGHWLRDGAGELVDAITEWLDMVCSAKALQARPELAELRGDGQLLHLHSTDAGLGEAGEWIIRRTPSGPVWEHGHSQGDVAVRGAVVDLLLVLLRRVTPGKAPIQLLGDPAMLEHWLEHTRF